MLNFFSRKKECKVLFLGIDYSGKTALLYRLKLGPSLVNQFIPTTGFNCETINTSKRDIDLIVYDVNGNLYRYWFHYFKIGIKAIFYIVDSSDRDRLDHSKSCLFNHILNHRDIPKDIVLIILANKQDVTNSLSLNEIQDALELYKVKFKWHIQSTSASNGMGVNESLDWLLNNITL